MGTSIPSCCVNRTTAIMGLPILAQKHDKVINSIQRLFEILQHLDVRRDTVRSPKREEATTTCNHSNYEGNRAILVQVTFHFELEAAAILQQVVSNAANRVRRKEEVCRFRFLTAVGGVAGQALCSKDVHFLQI